MSRYFMSSFVTLTQKLLTKPQRTIVFQNLANFYHSEVKKNSLFFVPKVNFVVSVRNSSQTSNQPQSILENISSLQLKKRPVRKKRSLEENEKHGIFSVTAYATAEEYYLEALMEGLKIQKLYEPRVVESNPDVLHAVAKYPISTEPREIFFFREGSIVLWNIGELESNNLLAFLKSYEQDSYSERLVQNELELMTYRHQVEGKLSSLEPNGEIRINPNSLLEKYTFANTLALSVKLGMWEASLDRYIDSIEYVTEDLKRGAKIKMSRAEALRKHGELFALRHLINLSSDLLDTPDFYWDREQLEPLYIQMTSYFSISRRTKVMNEKLNHCIELIELLSSHLTDKHHTRLEWMIIALIMVEVCFEVIHYLDRYLA